MRKLISLIIGWSIAYYLYLNWAPIKAFLGKDIAFFLLIYVVGLGVIHIGGITLKILAFAAAIIEPIADKYCYWYENTKFYRFFHKDEIR
ncbi:MAG: hypothetical protein K6E29_07340 [Cyanobacteria bacterium RUI128]|nr:hypothetical protein [Cyanobacteria bacterium RUI128]